MCYPKRMLALTDVDSILAHGDWPLWKPRLLATHAGSDILIGLSLASISIAILYFVKKSGTQRFIKIFYLFAIFIFSCSITYFFDALADWYPLHFAATVVKIFSAMISAASAIVLWKSMPYILTIPAPEDLAVVNAHLKLLNEDLEAQVARQVTDSIGRLQAERDTLVKVLDLNTDGWWDWNHDDVERRFMSHGFKELLGYGPNELRDPATWNDLIEPEDLESLQENFKNHLNSKGLVPFHRVVRYRHRSGARVWIKLMGVTIFNKNDQAERTIGFVYDVTREKEMQNNLEILNKELNFKNEELRTLLSTISHDLKTPIVTASSFLDFLEQDIADENWPRVEDSLTRIRAALKKMQFLTSDILELNKFGQIQPIFQLVSTARVVEKCLSLLGNAIDQKKFEVEVINPIPNLFADIRGVERAIENIVTNALKYGYVGDRRKITISGVDRGDEVELLIADKGPGIPESYLKKIFDPFFRLDSTSDGTGVGLAVVERIMKVQGGKVWVESLQGVGTTFHLVFRYQMKRGGLEAGRL